MSGSTIKYSEIKSQNICYHCGEEIPPGVVHELRHEMTTESGKKETSTLRFCCNGCLQVFQIIESSGNKGYYSYRTEFAPKPEGNTIDKWPYEVWDLEIEPDENGHKTAIFLIQGIHCASCVWLNEKILNQETGVLSAEVQLATNRATVTWDPKLINMRRIADVIAAIGYLAIPVKKTNEKEARKLSNIMLRRMAVAGFFMGNIMLVSVALYAGYFSFMDQMTKTFFHVVSWLMATPVLFYSAWPFFLNAWHSLKHRVLSMDLLTVTGLSLAYFYSVYVTLSGKGETYFDSLTVVTFAILIGRFIETKYKEKTLTYLENLGSGLPQIIHIRRDGQTVDEQIDTAKQGDIIEVHPGELVPLDALLEMDVAETDESMITGEFRPLLKTRGDVILAGSRCLGSSMVLKVTSTHENSTLSHITKLAEKSLRELPATQKLAEKASEYFILFVLLAGISTFVFWYFFQRGGVELALLHTISLLIVACPCALNLSIPTAFIVALQKAFKRGIILRGGIVLDELYKANVIVLDKTGTITEGKMSINDQKFYIEEKTDLLQLACALEKASGIHHPITRAFAAAYNGTVSTDSVHSLVTIPGRGISGVYNGETFYAGSRIFMEELGIVLEGEQSSDETLVYLSGMRNGKVVVLARFQLADTIRKEAPELMQRLHKKYRIVLLTGDHAQSAAKVASYLGISEYYANQKPEDKKEFIDALENQGLRTVMVGDGINDSIALARSHVGVSFAQAAQISTYSSSMLFLHEDLTLLADALELSVKTRHKIIQNLVLSFLYNILLLPLAFAGKIIPLYGAIFMSLSSIMVVTNSLQLARIWKLNKRIRKPGKIVL